MIKSTILISFFLILSCSSKKDVVQNNFEKKDLIGIWSLNKWTMYHTLEINDSIIYVDNHIDSVFYLKYKIEKNALIIWDETDSTGVNKAEIINLTKDSLIMKNFLKTSFIRYSRK